LVYIYLLYILSVLFSAAQTLHPDAEDLLLYVILQVRIPQLLILTDEYMVTIASKLLLIGLAPLS